MVRWFTILLVVFAGLPPSGIDLTRGPADPAACREPSWQAFMAETCCDQSTGVRICPISGGECRCVVAPLPEPSRRPDAPLPRTERDSLTAVRASPFQVVEFIESDQRPLVGCAQTLALHEGLTHNALQALLGVWRT